MGDAPDVLDWTRYLAESLAMVFVEWSGMTVEEVVLDARTYQDRARKRATRKALRLNERRRLAGRAVAPDSRTHRVTRGMTPE